MEYWINGVLELWIGWNILYGRSKIDIRKENKELNKLLYGGDLECVKRMLIF